MKTNISPFRIIPIAIFIFCLAGCDSSTIAEGAAREADRKCEAEQNFDLCINACKTGVEAARAEAVKAKLTFSSSDEEKEQPSRQQKMAAIQSRGILVKTVSMEWNILSQT